MVRVAAKHNGDCCGVKVTASANTLLAILGCIDRQHIAIMIIMLYHAILGVDIINY